MNKVKNKSCAKCASYKALYRRGFFMFWIEKQGLCCNFEKIVKEKDGCNFYQPQYDSIKAIIDLLDKSIDDITKLKKIYGVE